MVRVFSFLQKQPPETFYKKGVLANFVKFTGKHLPQGVLLKKIAGLRPATLLKKRHWCRCFRVNFAKFFRTRFLQNTSRRLLFFLVTINSLALTFSDILLFKQFVNYEYVGYVKKL